MSNRRRLHHLLTWTLIILQPVLCHAVSVIMDVTPSQGKISIGGQGSVQCRLQNADSATSLLWYRRQGNTWYKIGIDDILTLDNSVRDNRYRLQRDQGTDSTRNYRLTISDARLEDSATIECRLSNDLSVKADASGSFIVCGAVSSSFCDCMVIRGWASPDCFMSGLSNVPIAAVESMWRSVVGLIVAFVVVTAYTLVMLLVWKRESLHQCCQEEEAEDTRNLNGKSDSEGFDQGQVESSDSMSDSATCSTSDPPSSSGGSDGQGSGQSALGPHSKPHNRHKTETSFTVQPEIHSNAGYLDENSQPSTYRSRTRASPPPDPVPYEGNFQLKPSLAGHGAFGEVPYKNFDTRSNYDKPSIATVSGSIAGSMLALGGNQTQNNLGSYYTPSILSLHGSQLDTEGTEI